MRFLYPDQTWGSVASSVSSEPAEFFWQYLEPVPLHGERKCIEAIQGVVEVLDAAIKGAGVDRDGNQVESQDVIELLRVLGLEGFKNVKDWMFVVAIPLHLWQGKNWNMNLKYTHDWDYICSNLTSSWPQKISQFQGPFANGR